MLVDSSGSTNPPDSPTATQLRFQVFLRRPVTNLRKRGSASALPSRFFSNVAAASSSLRNLLEYTWPLPMRFCNGMRHCHPAVCAVARVYGSSGPELSQGTATARSQGSQCVQSSYPVCIVFSATRPYTPQHAVAG